MLEMVSAFIRYCAEQEMPACLQDKLQPGPPIVEEVYEMTVVDMFGAIFSFLFVFATEC
jgi:hypothetical protein